MSQDKPSVRELTRATLGKSLRNFPVDWWNEMSCELLVHLLAPSLQFFRLELGALRVLRVVAMGFAVALKTERHRIVDFIFSAFGLRDDVIDFDVHAARFLAQAAVPVAPQKNSRSKLFIEGHGACFFSTQK
jgi:hypothetical protein